MVEATRTTDNEREALIQEMLRDAKVVEPPNDMTANPVIHKGDKELDAPMVVKEMTGAGYVYMWDTRTFERIPVLYYMLPAKMRQRREDGSYRFTTSDPGKKPWRGTLKCFLHPEDENRKHYDELGFRFCKKDNLTNPYQRIRHMQLKHKQEWTSIETEQKEKLQKEDRELQRAILSKLGETKVEEAPLYVSEKDKRKVKDK